MSGKKGQAHSGLLLFPNMCVLQAVVKFSVSVAHVSMLYSVKELEMSTVVCCLADGMITVFNMASILQR